MTLDPIALAAVHQQLGGGPGLPPVGALGTPQTPLFAGAERIEQLADVAGVVPPPGANTAASGGPAQAAGGWLEQLGYQNGDALVRFQADANLPVTGIADGATFHALQHLTDPTYPVNLARYRDAGGNPLPVVSRVMHARLTQYGLNPVADSTLDALDRFQDAVSEWGTPVADSRTLILDPAALLQRCAAAPDERLPGPLHRGERHDTPGVRLAVQIARVVLCCDGFGPGPLDGQPHVHQTKQALRAFRPNATDPTTIDSSLFQKLVQPANTPPIQPGEVADVLHAHQQQLHPHWAAFLNDGSRAWHGIGRAVRWLGRFAGHLLQSVRDAIRSVAHAGAALLRQVFRVALHLAARAVGAIEQAARNLAASERLLLGGRAPVTLNASGDAGVWMHPVGHAVALAAPGADTASLGPQLDARARTLRTAADVLGMGLHIVEQAAVAGAGWLGVVSTVVRASHTLETDLARHS